MPTTDPRPAKAVPVPTFAAPSGSDSLNGQAPGDTQASVTVEGQDYPQAISLAVPKHQPPAGNTGTRTAIHAAAPKPESLSGPDSLNGQPCDVAHGCAAVEGQDSPQARDRTSPNGTSPAGSKTSRSHRATDTHSPSAAAEDIPGRHMAADAQDHGAAGEQGPPAATSSAIPIPLPLLADPLLALAADVLDDLEKVRIANENRLRQLTRTGLDADGLERGFGLDGSHPDVARLAALVGMLAEAEHKATLNLQRVMRKHPLGPWVKATTGIGEKQGARLIAAIGDPYWNTLHNRPRTVSELWAYTGYHVIKTPASGHRPGDTHPAAAAGGELSGSDPGQGTADIHGADAGVAPKRQRGQRANWSATAKMRAYLAAESCMKHRGSPYRAVYDAARVKYAEAVHDSECARCGPRNAPAKPGSPLSEGHKNARALRAVAKEILRDLWREARALHIR
jgi:hypothetical protein